MRLGIKCSLKVIAVLFIFYLSIQITVIFTNQKSILNQDEQLKTKTQLKGENVKAKTLNQFVNKPTANMPSEVLIHGSMSSLSQNLWNHEGTKFNQVFHDFPQPKLTMGKVAQNVEILMGITTVQRQKASYLLETVETLISNRGTNITFGILVFVGETNLTVVKEMYNEIWNTFGEEIQQGLIEVTSAPDSYYPDWEISLESNFGDGLDRVKWRSKQNLDVVFLMTHAHKKSPKYFLMLEDDILAKENYLKTVYGHVSRRETDKSWSFLSFSRFGTIGKLFRSSSLPSFVRFVSMFWNRKPIDWLQAEYVSVNYCSLESSAKNCQAIQKEKSPLINPPIFQHVGRFSSLKGKLQERKERNFKMKN